MSGVGGECLLDGCCRHSVSTFSTLLVDGQHEGTL